MTLNSLTRRYVFLANTQIELCSIPIVGVETFTASI